MPAAQRTSKWVWTLNGHAATMLIFQPSTGTLSSAVLKCFSGGFIIMYSNSVSPFCCIFICFFAIHFILFSTTQRCLTNEEKSLHFEVSLLQIRCEYIRKIFNIWPDMKTIFTWQLNHLSICLSDLEIYKQRDSSKSGQNPHCRPPPSLNADKCREHASSGLKRCWETS